MLFICPDLDFLSSSSVLLPSSSALFSQARQLSDTCCMSNTKHRLQCCVAGEVCRCCFSINSIVMQGERAPPLSPPLKEALACSGVLQMGQARLEPLNCVKHCFQNVTSILSIASTSWGSTSCLCSEPQHLNVCPMSARKQLLVLITLVYIEVCLHDATHITYRCCLKQVFTCSHHRYKAKPYKNVFDQN